MSWWEDELDAILSSAVHEELRDALADLLFRVESRDPLTGCWNRVYVEQRLEAEMKAWHASGIAVALLFIDLDGMRKINLEGGHHAGDLLLRQVVRHWEKYLPETQRMIRSGGDEFLVVLPGVTSTEAKSYSNTLHATFPGPLTFSCGLLHKSETDPLVSVASMCITGDKALFQAKAAGGNQTFPAQWPEM